MAALSVGVAAVAAGAPARYARGLADMVANSGIPLNGDAIKVEVASHLRKAMGWLISWSGRSRRGLESIEIARRLSAGLPTKLPEGCTVRPLTETRPGHYTCDGSVWLISDGPGRIEAWFEPEAVAKQKPLGVSMGGVAVLRGDGSLSDGDDS